MAQQGLFAKMWGHGIDKTSYYQEDLAYTTDEILVLDYLTELPAFPAPTMEETLLNLGCFLAWC
ncbi:hypothetical protein DSO57_1010793 [Entomophthora muscae]|uniref:Uncharacterized protein n=1 Tax=Entomophthora muscae TaxID=34485 RepID=A0ACC2URG0_9FUNG|nr:hypothetical protein DSO57_1010793 [Entomophthora muscae]